jgi:hypothetical protein
MMIYVPLRAKRAEGARKGKEEKAMSTAGTIIRGRERASAFGLPAEVCGP